MTGRPGPEPMGDPRHEALHDRHAEVALLRSLRLHRRELNALLDESSDHWGFEDPVYRFYHQSFKVYGLQKRIQSIVRLGAVVTNDMLPGLALDVAELFEL